MKKQNWDKFNQIIKWGVRIIIMVIISMFLYQKNYEGAKRLIITLIITFYECFIRKFAKIEIRI